MAVGPIILLYYIPCLAHHMMSIIKVTYLLYLSGNHILTLINFFY